MGIEAEFKEEMRKIYDRALAECNYPATRFLQMVEENGGVATAKKLLNSPHVSEGFVKLAMAQRIDLTMESLILQEKWKILFTDDELKIARRRLKASS